MRLPSEQAAEALARVLGTPWAALALGAVGVGLGMAVLFVGAADAQATVFHTPAFVTWIILYIGQIALWVVLAPSAWSAALKAGHTFGPVRWTGLGIGLTLLLLALFLPSAISPRLPGLPITNGRGDGHLVLFLDTLAWRVSGTVVIALLVLIAPSVAEIWMVQGAASRPWPSAGRLVAARPGHQCADRGDRPVAQRRGGLRRSWRERQRS